MASFNKKNYIKTVNELLARNKKRLKRELTPQEIDAIKRKAQSEAEKPTYTLE